MRPEDDSNRSKLETLCLSLSMLAFGLGVLAYLIAIDRAEWFNLRPASGTATALSAASHGVAKGEP